MNAHGGKPRFSFSLPIVVHRERAVLAVPVGDLRPWSGSAVGGSVAVGYDVLANYRDHDFADCDEHRDVGSVSLLASFRYRTTI